MLLASLVAELDVGETGTDEREGDRRVHGGEQYMAHAEAQGEYE
jgi:hypothetical protein